MTEWKPTEQNIGQPVLDTYIQPQGTLYIHNPKLSNWTCYMFGNRPGGVGKGDKDQQMERGRNFIQALKDTPKHLKRAGAKKGETVVGKPTAVMSGEDQKTGVAKRAKLYKKVFGKRSSEKSNKTGLMTGAVDK